MADTSPVTDQAGEARADPVFQPLAFRNLTVKNRVFRSSISGRIDNYDGSGTRARVNWEERFAAGGVGAIISAHAPVHVRGRILPNYALIDDDDKVPFWRTVGERVHAHGCAFLLQLSHGGRQRDIRGVENAGAAALSSTNTPDPVHGLPAQAMTRHDIDDVVSRFAAGARRAREAGLDGVELHACNGYLFTQFLSSAINDRKDDYGGSLENRARLLLEVVAAIRREVGTDFHLQVKVSAVDHGSALLPWSAKGDGLPESTRVLRWVEAAGADAVHVSTGSFFPHPLNPAGGFTPQDLTETYDTMLSSGSKALRNYALWRFPATRPLMRWLWRRTVPEDPEGLLLGDAAEIKRHVSIPVIVTGGFQTASVVRDAITSGACDAVSIARPLMANPDLVRQWEAGRDRPDRPCTYCNLCLFHVVEDPLGCYDVSRYDGSRERMLAELMSFYRPDGFGAVDVLRPETGLS
jgi:2,4-dienoyl-CoA reductase-like NADH-dependent reductase (Old Yellow Enzyme family)